MLSIMNLYFPGLPQPAAVIRLVAHLQIRAFGLCIACGICCCFLNTESLDILFVSTDFAAENKDVWYFDLLVAISASPSIDKTSVGGYITLSVSLLHDY